MQVHRLFFSCKAVMDRLKQVLREIDAASPELADGGQASSLASSIGTSAGDRPVFELRVRCSGQLVATRLFTVAGLGKAKDPAEVTPPCRVSSRERRKKREW